MVGVGEGRLFLVVVVDDGNFDWGIYPSEEQCVDWALTAYHFAEDSEGVAVDELPYEDRWDAFRDEYDATIHEMDREYVRTLVCR